MSLTAAVQSAARARPGLGVGLDGDRDERAVSASMTMFRRSSTRTPVGLSPDVNIRTRLHE
jgi:hypothetical protein